MAISWSIRRVTYYSPIKPTTTLSGVYLLLDYSSHLKLKTSEERPTSEQRPNPPSPMVVALQKFYCTLKFITFNPIGLLISGSRIPFFYTIKTS